MENYQKVRNMIPKKYEDDTIWYDMCGKYLDYDPQKIQFIFKGLPIDEEE